MTIVEQRFESGRKSVMKLALFSHRQSCNVSSPILAVWMYSVVPEPAIHYMSRYRIVRAPSDETHRSILRPVGEIGPFNDEILFIRIEEAELPFVGHAFVSVDD